MRQLVQRVIRLSNIFIVFALLSACTMSLVPQYQQSLVDGITAANTKATTLFASLALGSPQSQFSTYKPKYDEVIGALDALRASAQSRPISDLAAKFLGSGLLKGTCDQAGVDTNVCANSTPVFLASAIKVLTDVEKKHQRSGVAPDIIAYYKPLYDQQILFALTVENALKR